MKRIVSIGNWASWKLREAHLWKRGEDHWKPSYWNARNVHPRHERDVFFKERQAVDLAWSKLGLGMLKFGVVAVGSVISVVLYFQEQAKARKQQDSARLLAFAKESRRIVETYSQMKEVVESVKQVETVLRANHVKWQIGRTDSAIGLYVPTLETEKSRYRVDDLEVILALSDPGKSATSPFFVLSQTTQRPRQLTDIAEKFDKCVSLFAQFEQLAHLYAKTGETVDATFFPIEPVVLAKSIAFKCSNPLLVSAVRSFFQRRGERGQLALDFMERVTAKRMEHVPWTRTELVEFLNKYKTKPKIRNVSDEARREICKLAQQICLSGDAKKPSKTRYGLPFPLANV